jgi:hypothetical protein
MENDEDDTSFLFQRKIEMCSHILLQQFECRVFGRINEEVFKPRSYYMWNKKYINRVADKLPLGGCIKYFCDKTFT